MRQLSFKTQKGKPSMKISPLLKYKRNFHSQNGEDGILRELINRLGIHEPNWVCEFGAWDGKHFSNTFRLVEQGWRAVYIEGDSEKFSDLLATASEYKNIVPINEFVLRREGGAR